MRNYKNNSSKNRGGRPTKGVTEKLKCRITVKMATLLCLKDKGKRVGFIRQRTCEGIAQRLLRQGPPHGGAGRPHMQVVWNGKQSESARTSSQYSCFRSGRSCL